jgi:tetratricopeptide (TPR) repeat protein
MKPLIVCCLMIALACALCVSADTRKESEANLQALGAAAATYKRLHGQMPDRLSLLYEQGLITDLAVFSSPASQTTIENADQIDSQTDYTMIREIPDERPFRIVWEKEGLHDGKALALLSDRTVTLVSADITSEPVEQEKPLPAAAASTPVPVKPPALTEERALPVQRPAPAPKPDAYTLQCNRAAQLAAEGRWAESEAEARNAMTAEPDRARAHNLVAVAMHHQNKLFGAGLSHSDAVRLDPTVAHYYRDRARTYIKLNRDREALENYRTALRMEPQQTVWWQEFGTLLNALGRPTEAGQALQKAAGVNTTR